MPANYILNYKATTKYCAWTGNIWAARRYISHCLMSEYNCLNCCFEMSQVLSSNIGMSAQAYVSGAQRLNFIKKPLVATMNDVPLHLQPPVQEINTGQFQSSHEEEIIESKTKDFEIQTDYRDSTAQTDPYSPEEIYREGERPEVLMLKNLKYGKGLPASIEELDQIELNREKQWFENCLPPISDEASFNLRRKLMEEQELREWSKKEDQIKKLHAEGLELVKKGLIEREKDVEEKNSQRIEEIKIRKTEQKNRLIAKIQRKKIKILRKFTKARKDEDEDGNHRDIIEQYANFASRVYAGITREGLSLDKIANKYEVQPMALNTFEGLMKINPGEQAKPKHTQPDYTRLEKVHKTALEVAQSEIDKKLKPENQQNEVVSKDIEDLRNVIARPPTPNLRYDENFNITGPPITNLAANLIKDDSDNRRGLSKREVAILFLQRILRGRAQQNFMYEGKQKRLALIEELLIVAKIPNLPENEAEEILLQEHEQKLKNALLEGLQGEAIAETIDALSKELLRAKQQAKIAKLVDTAENDRRNREIDEAGKRNAQKIIRERQQYLYNQIARMNQGTVDTYLDWIINNTVDKASTRQASIMATLRKTEMNVPLEGFERRFNNNETVIRDLVQSFLLPNIQRSKLMKKVQLEERRFKQASKKSVQTTLTRVSAEIMENRQG